MARITEKYGLYGIIMKYMDPWLTFHLPRITKPGYESWLFAAYTFGLHTNYFDLAGHLAIHCEVNDRNELLKPDTKSPLEPIDVPRAHRKIDQIHTTKELC
jgi:hypothetical protein